MLLARDVMTRDVVTVPDDLPVAELARVLSERRILGAPVVDRKERLVGVVSASDVVANEFRAGHEVISEREYYCRPDLASSADFRRLGMHVEEYAGSLVRDIMTPVIISASPDSTVAEMADVMGMNRIHRLLVVEDGALCGVVSALDLLAYVRQPPRERLVGEILWATDLGPDSEHIGSRAIDLARRLGVRLVILHVTPDLAALWAVYGERPEVADLQGRLEEQALGRLKDLVKAFEQDVPALEIIRETGDPGPVALRLIEERRPAFVVVGAQRPPWERLSGIGSVAERVLAGSTAPVLVVPRLR